MKGNRSDTGNDAEALGTLPIGKLLARIAVPSSIALFVTSTYNLADAVFVGQGVGPEAIGALTLALPFQMMVVSFGALISVGASSIASRALGAQDPGRAERAAGTALSFALAFGVVTALLGIVFLDSVVRILGAAGDLLPPTRAYLFILLFGEPILLSHVPRVHHRAVFLPGLGQARQRPGPQPRATGPRCCDHGDRRSACWCPGGCRGRPNCGDHRRRACPAVPPLEFEPARHS